MHGDTESDSESKGDTELEQAAYALCMLAKGLQRRIASPKKPRRAEPPSTRETRKNRELVRVFQSRVQPVRGGTDSAAGSDVGRLVEVLWIPIDFPRYKRAKLCDLRPFKGRVDKHQPHRSGKTHRVFYEDKSIVWHSVDQLVFME